MNSFNEAVKDSKLISFAEIISKPIKKIFYTEDAEYGDIIVFVSEKRYFFLLQKEWVLDQCMLLLGINGNINDISDDTVSSISSEQTKVTLSFILNFSSGKTIIFDWEECFDNIDQNAVNFYQYESK
jgi:hypothetical protein